MVSHAVWWRSHLRPLWLMLHSIYLVSQSWEIRSSRVVRVPVAKYKMAASTKAVLMFIVVIKPSDHGLYCCAHILSAF